ncbi:unnamed protein product [Protopolystoma xenopodis]|uniref:Uncharacterized protein n=1 Tax=Protopolystoma xenopodis TaxID=117903 RepID=A0A448X325_9PLAT|nr:unnamed protein product [Protopolystoma xenopodis]
MLASRGSRETTTQRYAAVAPHRLMEADDEGAVRRRKET